jgi:hypothetical protein
MLAPKASVCAAGEAAPAQAQLSEAPLAKASLGETSSAETSFGEAASLPPSSVEEMIEAMAPGVEVVYLSLEDCAAAALENSLDIQVERHAPAISAAELTAQRGVFDPHLFFNVTYIDGEFPLPVRVAVATAGLPPSNSSSGSWSEGSPASSRRD